MSSAAKCPCGASSVEDSCNESYFQCRACGSALLRRELFPKSLAAVQDEAGHLYGKDYWYNHQAALGLPSIELRARADLIERCQYWLSFLLKHRLPPGRALEIGCAHGAFVKLLQLAGFAPVGMEMSPEIVAGAKARFGIDVVQGPLEERALAGPFDVVCAFDVLEHLEDPRRTLQAIGEALADDGVVVFQTPCHEKIADPKWPMYLPPEHTFLYSRAGVSKLLASVGLSFIKFEPAIFGYDMFGFASRQPLAENSRGTIESRLCSSPDGRIALALQDLYEAAAANPAADLASRHGSRVLGREFIRALRRSVLRRVGLRT